MLKWLGENEAESENLQVELHSSGQRKVIASKDIIKTDPILFIPRKCFITLNDAFRSPIGQRIYDSSLE